MSSLRRHKKQRSHDRRMTPLNDTEETSSLDKRSHFRRALSRLFHRGLHEDDEPTESTSPSELDIRRANDLHLEGIHLYSLGDYGEAVVRFSKAIRLCPDDYVLHSRRSSAYMKMMLYHRALMDARTSLDLNPDYPKGYCQMGVAYGQLGYHDRAELCYLQARELGMHLSSDGRGNVLAARSSSRMKRRTVPGSDQRYEGILSPRRVPKGRDVERTGRETDRTDGNRRRTTRRQKSPRRPPQNSPLPCISSTPRVARKRVQVVNSVGLQTPRDQTEYKNTDIRHSASLNNLSVTHSDSAEVMDSQRSIDPALIRSESIDLRERETEPLEDEMRCEIAMHSIDVPNVVALGDDESDEVDIYVDLETYRKTMATTDELREFVSRLERLQV